MEFNSRLKSILELARKYSSEYGNKTLGSEYLILAMYETKDSLCHFLLNEYEVTRDEIFNKTRSLVILRKRKGEYNQTIEDILNQANVLAMDKKISEEHLFMAILQNRNNIACNILESLGLSIDDLIQDVKEIYDFNTNSTDELSYVKNITKSAKLDELQKFIGRDEYLKKIDIILHRRFKNNPLLIGNAGVGKTALVEGYSKYSLDNNSDISILSINLTSMLAGTRYRGDFEERFDKFIKEIATKKDVVIFIDEIHTIVSSHNTEGNLDVANMLKPFLARNDIKLIGATTLDEYYKTIAKDKALLRRFQPIFVKEPSIEETKEIMFGIKEEYEKYHNVKISDNVLNYLITQSNKKILNKYRPDKCIDLLDDILSLCSVDNINEVSIEDIDNMLNTNINDIDLTYQILDKYKWLYSMDLLNQSPLLKICYKGNNEGLNLLTLDLLSMFKLSYEAILEIDTSILKEHNSITSLIGAPPGYVGYEDDGILTKHLSMYPMSIIVFKNISTANKNIQSFIINSIKKGYLLDRLGSKIELSHTIIIIDGLIEKQQLGFNDSAKSNDIFDEYIIGVRDNTNYNKEYIESLKRYSYELSFDFDISNDNKRLVNDYLYKLLKNSKKGKYEINKDKIGVGK